MAKYVVRAGCQVHSAPGVFVHGGEEIELDEETGASLVENGTVELKAAPSPKPASAFSVKGDDKSH